MSAPVPFLVVEPEHKEFLGLHQAFYKAGLAGGHDYFLFGNFERVSVYLAQSAGQVVITDTLPGDANEASESLARLKAGNPGLKLWYFSNTIPVNAMGCDRVILGSPFGHREAEDLVSAMKARLEALKQQSAA